MTTLGVFAGRLNPQPTVKCSTCESDVELAKLADHTCSNSAGFATELNDVRIASSERIAMTQTPLTAEPMEMEESHPAPLPKRGVSLYQRQKPSLPKIDSNAPRRELDPREAASIAHDLGLPSPVSAGPGKRSPKPHLPRKASSPRVPLAPPSPELPISQDCAFPPFPTNKPKRTLTTRDDRGPKPRSVSRANTHDATLSHSTLSHSTLSHSTSSSLYSSASSGLVKSRTSDTSSNQRSRQGTLNGAPSPPSTAPSSPRDSLEKHTTIDRPENAYSSVGHGADDISFTPPPSAVAAGSASDLAEMSSKSNQDSECSDNNMNEFQEQQTSQSNGGNAAVTFDNLLSGTGPRVAQSVPQTYSEPSYKSKRPPPLDQMSEIPPERQFPAINMKSPAAPMSAGLGRTLTNLFSRKRSQSVSSKKAAKFDVNSPRMKALAPEPPPIPTRSDSEFGITDHDDRSYFPPQASMLEADVTNGHPAVSPLTAAEEIAASQDTLPAGRDVVSPLNSTDQKHQYSSTLQVMDQADDPADSGFDFKFNDGSKNDGLRKTDTIMIQTDFENALANIAPATSEQPEISLQRASIDSASSYGSVRYSQHTISTRSSPPPSDELRSKISNALRSSTATIDLHESSDSAETDRQFDLYNSVLTAQRRLSPVFETATLSSPPGMEVPASPENEDNLSNTEMSSASSRLQSPSKKRPITPAGNKGVCRGCANVIEFGQKSVSSKDGRLTGKYHKDCFGCQTCRQPFVTADFYVFDDHPYCSHHYHVLNNTLCTSCNKGIEGQYFETSDITGQASKKFHPRCLVCATCRVQLQDDYFEFQGHVYCEKDAFRAANGPAKSVYDNTPARPSPLNREYLGSGAPNTKGRFPERRTTKLMMT